MSDTEQRWLIAIAVFVVAPTLLIVGYQHGKRVADKWWEDRWLTAFTPAPTEPAPCKPESSLWAIFIEKQSDGKVLMSLSEYGQTAQGITIKGTQEVHTTIQRWFPNQSTAWTGASTMSTTIGKDCTIDGLTWWPARGDGACYAADAPKK